MYKKSRGFSLLELLIALAIVGVTATIAYPSYVEHTKKSRRAEAQAALVSFANAMERHNVNNGNYLGAASGGGNTGAPDSGVFPAVVPITGGTKTYDLTINAATASTFILKATPVTAYPDPTCGSLTLDNAGTKTPTTPDCW